MAHESFMAVAMLLLHHGSKLQEVPEDVGVLVKKTTSGAQPRV